MQSESPLEIHFLHSMVPLGPVNSTTSPFGDVLRVFLALVFVFLEVFSEDFLVAVASFFTKSTTKLFTAS